MNRAPSLSRATPDDIIDIFFRGQLHRPLWQFQERDVSRAIGLPSPQAQPFIIREQYSGPTRVIPDPPPTSTTQRNTQTPTRQESKTLRKEIYNPMPKRITRRLNLYYREDAKHNFMEKAKEKDDDDGKRCAICLDDFEPKEEVTLTPCDHMFHGDCLGPWLKSHSQCPVCRAAVSEQESVPSNNNTAAIMDASDLWIMSLLRI